jgi:BirA family biotin operon repressor/biotin-[acetyl-CoA-carboxylase] ligase
VVISPTTLFTGQQLIWLPACASTNSEAQQLLRENRASEGCTVITDDQFAGRGQRGNQWLAAPGENLTLSIVWLPTFLEASRQFMLSQAVALGVHDWASALLQPSDKLRVKWPNDLYFGTQKFGGILIENSLSGSKIQSSIVGVGLNVNQRHFAVPTATSLGALTGRYFQRETLAARLLECLEKRYLQLRAGQFRELRRDYLAALYRYQEWHEYEIGGRRVHGQIVGVEPDGRLALQVNDEVQHFGLQEIKYL